MTELERLRNLLADALWVIEAKIDWDYGSDHDCARSEMVADFIRAELGLPKPEGDQE